MLGRLILAAGSRLMGADLAAILRSAHDSADNIEEMLPKETKAKPRIACQQKCGSWATVYAIDPIPGGWGGYFCASCANALRFQVTDRL